MPRPVHFGAVGSTTAEELEAEGTREVGWAIAQTKRYVETGAYMFMFESGGIPD